MVPWTVDYTWDFAVEGGAVDSFVLVPSREVPAGTVPLSFLTAQGQVKVGPGNLEFTCDDVQVVDTGGAGGNQFKRGTVPDGVGALGVVKAVITTDVLTAGRVVLTLLCLTPEL